MQQLATRLVSTRRGTLLAAMLIALIAGASILLYLNSYRDSLKTESAVVTVLVAKRNIPKGTAGSVVAAKDFYTVTTIRESQLLEGAMSDPATLRGRVATREIFEGAQLTAADFGAAGDSLAAQLTDRQRVVTVPFDSAHGLIDGIEAGNRVDVYAGFKVVPIGIDGRPLEGGQARPVLRLVLSDVPILALGEKGKGAGSSKTNVSLGVDDLEAAQIAFASDNGQLWLALRPSAGAKASRPDIVTVETLLLGVSPVQMLKVLGGRS
jgi:Flp pilus assembly protein CpaB